VEGTDCCYGSEERCWGLGDCCTVVILICLVFITRTLGPAIVLDGY